MVHCSAVKCSNRVRVRENGQVGVTQAKIYSLKYWSHNFHIYHLSQTNLQQAGKVLNLDVCYFCTALHWFRA